MFWPALDRFLARVRPALDLAVVAAAWHATYLFRLGFERWFSARPGYDAWVLGGLLLVYAATFVLLRVPKGVWRFSGFGEVQRLALACGVAGLLGATAVLMLGLAKVPRSVLGLHPVLTLAGLAMTRMAYRMLYEHARSRITEKTAAASVEVSGSIGVQQQPGEEGAHAGSRELIRRHGHAGQCAGLRIVDGG